LSLAVQRQYHAVIEKVEDGYYIAAVIELPGCDTQAKTLKLLDKRIKKSNRSLSGGAGSREHIVGVYRSQEGKV
jgi:hypothetical protein